MLVGVSVFFVQWCRAASMMQMSLLERFATSVGAQHTDTLVVTHTDDLLMCGVKRVSFAGKSSLLLPPAPTTL